MMKYKHHPIDQAKSDFKAGRKQRYKVTTINWTLATENGEKDYSKVHHNTYGWTLEHLIKFIRETELVAEDVIDIEKV
jgi:hypothetical protein